MNGAGCLLVVVAGFVFFIAWFVVGAILPAIFLVLAIAILTQNVTLALLMGASASLALWDFAGSNGSNNFLEIGGWTIMSLLLVHIFMGIYLYIYRDDEEIRCSGIYSCSLVAFQASLSFFTLILVLAATYLVLDMR